MGEYESGVRDNVISLKSRKFRKKHQKLFSLLNKLYSIFHKGTKYNSTRKENYKSTVNH